MASKAKPAATAAAAKVFKGKARLMCFSGEAKPGPAIGQALGPLGVNMAEFCKQFNAATAHMKPGLPTPCRLTAYADRTFSFEVKSPPTVWFLKKCANVDKGSSKAVKEIVGRVTLKQVFEIAQIKQKELPPSVPIIAVCRMVAGTAKSMGLDVVDGRDVIPKSAAATGAGASGSTSAGSFSRRGKKESGADKY